MQFSEYGLALSSDRGKEADMGVINVMISASGEDWMVMDSRVYAEKNMLRFVAGANATVNSFFWIEGTPWTPNPEP